MKEANKEKKCPEKEFLSLYADDMLSSDLPEFKHISACEKCKAEVMLYKKLGAVIQDSLFSAVPENFAETSVSKFRERLANEESKIIPFPVLVLARVASILFFLSSVIFFVSSLVTNEEENPPASFARSEDSSHEATTQLPSATNEKMVANNISPVSPQQQVSKGEASFQDNSVSFENMALTSAGASGQQLQRFSSYSNTDRPAQIPKIVRHVWSVKDIEAAKTRLVQIISQNKDGQENIHSRAKDNSRIKFALGKLQKKQLVEIVKQLSEEGFKLLSPQEPQPERQVFEGAPEEPVRYYFDIVKS
ncbi:MAG: hypothetical protein QXH80_02975 [Candidatus Nanoarchaeia archaeon]